MVPNSAYTLVSITTGTSYAPAATTQNFYGAPTLANPTGVVSGISGPMTPPIFALFCTVANTGNVVIRPLGAPDDASGDITFPAGSFKQGVVYYIYLKKVVSDDSTVKFVGYQYSGTPLAV